MLVLNYFDSKFLVKFGRFMNSYLYVDRDEKLAVHVILLRPTLLLLDLFDCDLIIQLHSCINVL